MRIRNTKDDGVDLGVMKMGTYVNPALANQTDYFAALDKMMKCVEQNSNETDPARQEKICAKEFKALRLQAFKKNLLYHEINKRFVMHEYLYKKNMSGF